MPILSRELVEQARGIHHQLLLFFFSFLLAFLAALAVQFLFFVFLGVLAVQFF